jgi:hypothetical protein
MTLMIQPDKDWDTNRLLAEVLSHCANDQRVQFLVEPRADTHVVQRLRVALSRSRNRNRRANKKVNHFTLRHSIHPYTSEGKRFSCIVMWVEKDSHHRQRELLDDLMERDS